MFYRPFSYFLWNFEIKLLVLYCSECHFKNRLALSLPKFFLQPLLKIHFQIFMKIHHSQWFIDIGYVNLTTKNRGALGRKNKVRYLYFLYITWGRLTWGRFCLGPIWPATSTLRQHQTKIGTQTIQRKSRLLLVFKLSGCSTTPCPRHVLVQR